MEKKKVLITTIQPVSGGVPSMLKIIIDYLRQREYQVTLAFYQPYNLIALALNYLFRYQLY